ncbi:MAG: HAMP domain-containing sensor histidine kinase [Phycisphaerales bacterium]
METVLKSTSLVQRAHWLIRLRWVAIVALGCATFGASEFMGVSLPSGVLYGISAVLLVYNLALRQVLVYWTRAGQESSEARVGGVLTFQISADLFILTMILHFSGGVENPFLLFFAFHMIIASILRSKRQSYLQATLAVTLFGGLVVLEAAGGIAHYSLEGFAGHQLYRDWTYVFGTLFVFTVTLYVIVYMTTSISEQLRRRQEDLEKANAQLQEKDQVKNEYVLRVTHDIKGHLAAVLSCLDLVHGEILGPLNEKQKDFVGRAHRRTTSCLEFARALLKLTRMKLTGRLEIEQFSLKKVILNVLALVQNKAQSKSISLSHQIDPGIDKIWGEAVLVEETIANILFNAVKYTPDGGKVSLEARPEGNLVWIRVTDTGIGVPDGDSSRIFEEFYRAENARETERDGTGLGLAFARQVVERHGGRIWVEGNPGGGSIFTFTLPLRPSGGGG